MVRLRIIILSGIFTTKRSWSRLAAVDSYQRPLKKACWQQIEKRSGTSYRLKWVKTTQSSCTVSHRTRAKSTCLRLKVSKRMTVAWLVASTLLSPNPKGTERKRAGMARTIWLHTNRITWGSRTRLVREWRKPWDSQSKRKHGRELCLKLSRVEVVASHWLSNSRSIPATGRSLTWQAWTFLMNCLRPATQIL